MGGLTGLGYCCVGGGFIIGFGTGWRSGGTGVQFLVGKLAGAGRTGATGRTFLIGPAEVVELGIFIFGLWRGDNPPLCRGFSGKGIVFCSPLFSLSQKLFQFGFVSKGFLSGFKGSMSTFLPLSVAYSQSALDKLSSFVPELSSEKPG